MSPIDSRVVQRAILNVLQISRALQIIFKNPFSFGGIENRGVPDAISAVMYAIRSGCTHYITSDISDFFRNIPKDKVLQTIQSVYNHDQFMDILIKATDVELENMTQLGADSTYFDFHEVGVAQGCCLSPFFGNILLKDFDIKLNKNGIFCFRYIDDFIILGPTQRAVDTAFSKALVMLDKLKLSAYSPNDGTGKSIRGRVNEGITLLGCSVLNNQIMPSSKNCKKLQTDIETIFNSSISTLANPIDAAENNQTMIDALIRAKNVLKGWGNTYAFCNHKKTLRQLDQKITELKRSYMQKCMSMRSRYLENNQHEDSRRVLGVQLLVDTKTKDLPQWQP